MEEVWQNRQQEVGFCEGCPGCESPYPLGGVGNDDADIMLVGVEPAYNLDELYVDMDMSWQEAKPDILLERKASDNPLWRHMENVALAADCAPGELYFTNVAKCAAGSYEERVENCIGYFKQEVITVDPDVILVYGGKAIDAVFDVMGLEQSGTVGNMHTQMFETSSYKVVPLYHWGYIYRRGSISEYNTEVAKVVSNMS
jgi:uracil-DNA glycosylase family 4